MIWIDVTARAARQVRALAARQPAPTAPSAPTEARFGLRITVDREATGPEGYPLRLSLSTLRTPSDLVLPRFGFDVLVHGDDTGEVDGLRIDFVTGPQGSGFVVDRIPRPRPPSVPDAAPAARLPSPPATAPGGEQLTERVQRALDEVRPALRADGGDVELVSVAAGIAYLRLEGACSGCSAALLTLNQLIDRAVLASVPEITRTVVVA
jgi:iron-sulfur cluster assembly protein